MDQQQSTNTRETARQSFTGKRLSNAQFDEAWQVTGIIHREIEKSGSFIEKLTDYAHAFARSQKFDAGKGEMILRDIYQAQFGQSMNQTRETLVNRQQNLRTDSKDRALDHAKAVVARIQDGETAPYWRALDESGVAFAQEQGITETDAKAIIKDAFETVERKDFYKVCKNLEDTHHRPVAEAERSARMERRNSRYTNRAPQQSYAQRGPRR